jgi:hypothetical protein
MADSADVGYNGLTWHRTNRLHQRFANAINARARTASLQSQEFQMIVHCETLSKKYIASAYTLSH